MQIGNIDAITYCLDLSPDFIEINEEMMRLLSEALALTDAEDQALVNNPTQLRASLPSLINLRHVCIKMLTSAIARPEFSQPRYGATRSRIISVFFKFLYSKSPKVVAAAYDGLQRVLVQQQKLPKDLLQAGLRPILLNLSDYRHLNVASLEGLARLMKLLTNYFKVEVGKKLLDHLHSLADPAKLRLIASKTIKDLHEIKILVAILDIFHLLPSSAVVLLDELVVSVLRLEKNLSRRQSSPFRSPLFLFMDRYPEDTIKYFLERIGRPSYARLFIHAVSEDQCSNIRLTLVEQHNKLTALLAIAQANSSDSMEVDDDEKEKISGAKNNKENAIAQPTLRQMHGCLLIQALETHFPNLLDDHSDLDTALTITLWDKWSQTAQSSTNSARLTQTTMLKSILETVTSSMVGTTAWIQRVFRIVVALDKNLGILDSGQIECFFTRWSQVLTKTTNQQRRDIIALFFEHFGQKVSDAKACILRRVTVPLILSGIYPPRHRGDSSTQPSQDSSPACNPQEMMNRRAAELLSEPIQGLLRSHIWIPFSSAPESNLSGVDDYLRLQYISLSFVLLRKAPDVVSDVRKDMIRFGWTCIKHDDPIVKHAAYVFLSQFIATFETPSKIIMQVLIHLLRAHQPEYRPMVRQALEILVPSLPTRLLASTTSTEPPVWIKWINRVLFEHGHTVGQIIHIYQLIAHLPDMFYPYYDQFTPKLINSLTKLCLTQSATLETRNLALDIIEMLLDWDEKHVKGLVPLQRSESTPLSQLRQEVSSQVITEQKREAVVGILLRILCLAYDFVAKSGLAKRLNLLLRKYLDQDSWPPMHLRLTFFERALSSAEIKTERLPFFEHILHTLELVTLNMREAWVVENFSTLASIIVKFLKTESMTIQELLAKQLARLYSAMNTNETLQEAHTSTNFLTSCSDTRSREPSSRYQLVRRLAYT